MKLDVVVPTYNRSQLLRRTIDSLLRATIPVGMEVTILVADNNSNDNTEQVVREIQEQTERSIYYITATRQGSSNSRNAGIAAGNGDLIGFVDDDEEVNPDWYEVVGREFANENTRFIGGPYLANCCVPMPDWLPDGYNAVIGVVHPKPRSVFSPSFPGILMSGNAVIRREVFNCIGNYSAKLGRTEKGLLSEEDAEFYRRLLAANIVGYHVPDLIIHHHIPQERLTKAYHRRWCYWRGVSQGVLDRELQQSVTYMVGVPRHLIGRALKGMVLYPVNRLEHGAAKAFADELAIWDLLGFLYGKHFIRIERFYAEKG